MTKQTTGEFMATLRKANGYTQQEMADKLNVSNRTLSSWETDRTLPDILMLPAIADLFNVTVDELLRGERSDNTKANTAISENSLKSVYKNRFGGFTAKLTLLLGIALICVATLIIGCSLSLWTDAPAWLDWTLLVLSFAGLCTCIAVITFHYYNTKLTVGVVFDEDLTDDKKAFIAALRHRLENFVLLCALPFAVFGVITLVYFIISNPHAYIVFGHTIYVRYAYIFAICTNFVLFAVMCSTHFILKAISIKTYYSETQRAVAKNNRKLVGRIALFGSIPLATVIVLNIVLALVFPNGNKVAYKNDSLDEFRTYMHTLVINDREGLPDGEYYLAFPDKLPTNGTECDLGNGFYGVYHCTSFSTSAIQYTAEYWEIAYGKEGEVIFENGKYVFRVPVPTWDLYVYRIGDSYVTNARHYEFDHAYNDSGNRLDISIEQRNKTYCLIQDISNTLSDVAIYSCTIVPISTIVACAIIYGAKHKKQKYNF